MKKQVIAVGLLVNAVLLVVVIGLLSKERMEVVNAAGGGGAPKGNGDVNGDGKYSVTDAIYLLRWLFTEGPEPISIERPPPIVKGLPATGQTKCRDKMGGEISCNNADFPGQDAFYQAGCPSEGRFVDNGDGTVTDTCTGLMWQKNTAVPASKIFDHDLDHKILWQDALNYCELLGPNTTGQVDVVFGGAGYDDWRLPNVRELQSIIDYGRVSPSIDPVFGAESAWYWSSSSFNVSDPVIGRAWTVGFITGDSNGYGNRKDGLNLVRAVRNAR
jgi:uncharacterized protein DUF1566